MPGFEITRTGNKAKIVCDATGYYWILLCDDNQWIGQMPSAADCPIQGLLRRQGTVIFVTSEHPSARLALYCTHSISGR